MLPEGHVIGSDIIPSETPQGYPNIPNSQSEIDEKITGPASPRSRAFAETPPSSQPTLEDLKPEEGNEVSSLVQERLQIQNQTDLPKAIGKIIYPDESYYEGEIQNGLAHGTGKTVYLNGSCYEGEFHNGQKNGHGQQTYLSGNHYEGEFQNNQRNGHGKLTYANGDCYEGEFQNGRPHGHGQKTYSNGDHYEGEFQNSEQHGHGKLTLSSGHCYEGEFQNEESHGHGKLTYPEGTYYEGKFQNNSIKSNASHLGDLRFLTLLLGKNKSGGSSLYPLGIISDYLKKQKSYQEEAHALEMAIQMHLREPDEIVEKSEEIHKKLTEQRQAQLFPYNTTDHSMLLNLAPYTSKNGEQFIDCKIFNSGSGLSKHHLRSQTEDTLKYQTMLRRRVPLINFTPNTIENLLKNNSLMSINEAYDKIFNLKDSETVLLDNQSAIWQTRQHGENCSIECIFAYLKNTMSKTAYNHMRMQLFRDCLEAVNNNPKISPEEKAEIVLELEKKIKKREKRRIDLLAKAMSPASKVINKITYPDGSYYEGETQEGLPHGQGKIVWVDEDFDYIGNFLNGRPNGHGKQTYSDGTYYEGNFQNGQQHGYGKETYPDGSYYEGEFKNGQISGYGKLTHADGTCVEGIFDDVQQT